MNVKTFKRLQEGDYQDAPDWFRRFLGPVNDQFESLTQAISGRLGIVDNSNNELIDLELVHDQFAEVALSKIRGKPIGAFIVDNGTPGYASLAAEVVNQSSMLIKVKWDTDPGEPTRCKILVVGS